jgi:DNA-binding NarL/FixJ family response regulator
MDARSPSTRSTDEGRAGATAAPVPASRISTPYAGAEHETYEFPELDVRLPSPAFEASPSRYRLTATGAGDDETQWGWLVARVLVVEDQPLVGRTVKRQLGGHGLDVEVVATKAEALRRLRGPVRLDGFLLDLRLEGDLDGLDVLDAVIAAHPNTPRAMMSGHLSPVALDRAMLFGTAFICKPCGKRQLARFALDVLSTCITETALRAHVVDFAMRAGLSPTEQTILASLVAGGSRNDYATRASVSSKTVDAQIGNTLLKAKSAGVEVGDIKDLVATLLRTARICDRR